MAFLANPPIPYVGQLRGVSPGRLLSIAGQPTPTAKWFAVNIQCGVGVNPRDDIALHINPRFDGAAAKVVRNSLQAGQWGIEENFGHFPFVPGQPFDLLILVEHDVFKIAVNGQHFTEFRHRMPLNRANTLAVDGDVILNMIRYEGGDAGLPQQPPPMQGAGYQQPPQYSQPPSVPQYSQPGYSASHLPNPAYATPGYSAGVGHSPSYGGAPGYGTGMPGSHSPSYGATPGYSSYGASTSPMPVPGHSGGGGYMKMGGAAALGAVGGYAMSRLMYPGGGGGMMGHGGMMMGKKGKMKKMKHGKHGMMGGHFPHKLKHHKMKAKKWHKKGGSSSSSSSSEEE